jgi:hypothetical protein
MAVAYPSPPPPVIKRKSRKGLFAVVAIALVLLLVIGIAGLLSLRPAAAMSLSPSTVAAGDSIQVTASHLPPNQNGEIRLHSPVQSFPFRADSNGDVNRSITVPSDEGIGDHTVQVCWNSACRITAILHVQEAVAIITPSATPSPSTTPTATPGSTPTPLPSPLPTPRATSTPAHAPSVTVAAISKTSGFTAVLHYTDGGMWSIYVYDVTLARNNFVATISVPAGSTFYSQHFTTPSLVVATNKAYVTACSATLGRCYSSDTVTVGL